MSSGTCDVSTYLPGQVLLSRCRLCFLFLGHRFFKILHPFEILIVLGGHELIEEHLFALSASQVAYC